MTQIEIHNTVFFIALQKKDSTLRASRGNDLFSATTPISDKSSKGTLAPWLPPFSWCKTFSWNNISLNCSSLYIACQSRTKAWGIQYKQFNQLWMACFNMNYNKIYHSSENITLFYTCICRLSHFCCFQDEEKQHLLYPMWRCEILQRITDGALFSRWRLLVNFYLAIQDMVCSYLQPIKMMGTKILRHYQVAFSEFQSNQMGENSKQKLL